MDLGTQGVNFFSNQPLVWLCVCVCECGHDSACGDPQEMGGWWRGGLEKVTAFENSLSRGESHSWNPFSATKSQCLGSSAGPALSTDSQSDRALTLGIFITGILLQPTQVCVQLTPELKSRTKNLIQGVWLCPSCSDVSVVRAKPPMARINEPS
jgi:hypothetical protein